MIGIGNSKHIIIKITKTKMSGSRNNIKNDCNDDDGQIMNGLVAAQQYQEHRQHLSLSTQEDMMDSNFGTRLPEGTTTMLLTEDEYVQLQSSIRGHANQQMANAIAHLREQLTEYHSLLDQLSTITDKNKLLQRTVLDRDNRIDALEQELATLKRERGQQDTTNCTIGGGRRITITDADLLPHVSSSFLQQPIISIPSSSSAFQPANKVTPRQGFSSNLFCCSLDNNKHHTSVPTTIVDGYRYHTPSPMMSSSNNQVPSNNYIQVNSNNNSTLATIGDGYHTPSPMMLSSSSINHIQLNAGHPSYYYVPMRKEKKRTISTDESSDIICTNMSNHRQVMKRLKKG